MSGPLHHWHVVDVERTDGGNWHARCACSAWLMAESLSVAVRELEHVEPDMMAA